MAHSLSARTDLDLTSTGFLSGSMRIIEEDNAALTIQKAWRKSRAGVDHLRKDAHDIARIPLQKFKGFCRKFMNPLLRKGCSNLERRRSVISAIDVCRKERNTLIKAHYFPVCTSLGKRDKLPEFVFTNTCKQLLRLPDGHLLMTPDVDREFAQIPKVHLQNKEELDKLVQALSKANDLLSWDEMLEGCYARAQVMIDLLELCGVPAGDMTQQYIWIPIPFRRFPWKYHVVPHIRIADGSVYIIDPTVSKDQALTIPEWIQLLRREENRNEKMDIVNAGELGDEEDELDFEHDPAKECLIFTTDRNLSLEEFTYENGIQFNAFTTEMRNADLTTLARLRIQAEDCCLGPDQRGGRS